MRAVLKCKRACDALLLTCVHVSYCDQSSVKSRHAEMVTHKYVYICETVHVQLRQKDLLRGHLAALDKEYDKCHETWAKGEFHNFNESSLPHIFLNHYKHGCSPYSNKWNARHAHEQCALLLDVRACTAQKIARTVVSTVRGGLRLRMRPWSNPRLCSILRQQLFKIYVYIYRCCLT